MNIHQWKKHINTVNDSFKKDKAIHDQWNAHTEANLPKFNRDNSIWALDFKYYGKDEKAIILVGSSPSLKNDVKYLRDIDDVFRIVCANSALKFLLKNGVKPHYCICLDSDDIDIPKHLDCDNKDITLLANTAMSPKALDKWKGPVYFLPYYSIRKDLIIKIKNKLGKMIQGGGNSMSCALWIVSVIFNSKTIIFCGNEYCFDKVKNYYADKNASKQEKMEVIYPVKDILDRDRWTQPAHYSYAMWIEKCCQDLTPGGFFIDTSFGLLGTDVDSVIQIMKMEDVIKKIRWSFKIRDKLNQTKIEEERLKIIANLLPKDDPSKVYHYHVSEHREQLLQLARS